MGGVGGGRWQRSSGGVAETQIAQRFQQLPSAVEIEVGGHFVLGGASGGEYSQGRAGRRSRSAPVWVHRHQQLAQIASSSSSSAQQLPRREASLCVFVLSAFWRFRLFRISHEFGGTAHSQPVWLVNEKLKNN